MSRGGMRTLPPSAPIAPFPKPLAREIRELCAYRGDITGMDKDAAGLKVRRTELESSAHAFPSPDPRMEGSGGSSGGRVRRKSWRWR